MIDQEVNDLIEKMGILDKMYDQLRLVDPVAKRVLLVKDRMIDEQEAMCYDFWKRGGICNNCISMRAYNQNQSFVKIEYSAEDIYMVTALPVEFYNRRVVLEILKNVTDSMILDHDDKRESAIYSLIESMNNTALRDALTGVHNRRFINEKLPVDMISVSLAGQPISIIMADIDYFKRVNDTYGHLAGDNVLKRFAELLSGCLVRGSDWIARFGGEEFLICLPGANLDRAKAMAEEMRKTVEDNEFVFGENKLKITASFGVCSVQPQSGVDTDIIIDHADKKLYDAKKNGRNRVEA